MIRPALALFAVLMLSACAAYNDVMSEEPATPEQNSVANLDLQGGSSLLIELPACLPGTSPMMSTQLFFGRAIPGGGEVSDEQWDKFVARVVAKHFPEGFTIYEAQGAWRGEDSKLVREDSRVIQRVHEPGADQDGIAAVIEAYKRAFKQESVMRVDSLACVGF